MYGMLWPKPTGRVELSNELIHLLPGDISISAFGNQQDQQPLSSPLLEELRPIFKEYLYMMHPKYASSKKKGQKNPFVSSQSANANVRVVMRIADNGLATYPTMEVDESYRLVIEAG